MGGKKRESKDDLWNRLNLKIAIVVHIFKITRENNGKYNKRDKGPMENFDRDK